MERVSFNVILEPIDEKMVHHLIVVPDEVAGQSIMQRFRLMTHLTTDISEGIFTMLTRQNLLRAGLRGRWKLRRK